MDLLALFKKKKEERGFFLTLTLKPYSVGAILFEEENGKLIILAAYEVEIEKEVSLLGEEVLVEVCDEVISLVEKSLPQETQEFLVQKTIFSVPYDWVEEGKIKKEFLLRLKKICQNLELTPIGFVIPIETVVAFLQKQEGVPLSCIFVELSKRKVVVYIVRVGNIVEAKMGNTDGNVVKVVEGLLREVEEFEVLPARIVLFGDEQMKNVQQEFLSYHFSKDLPFIHLPKIVFLERGFENEAIISGVASQMGFEVLEELKVTREEDEKVELTLHDFGFLKEEDIALVTRRREEKEEAQEKPAIEEKVEVKRREERFNTTKIVSLLNKFKSFLFVLPKVKTQFFLFFHSFDLPFKKIYLIAPILIFIIFLILSSFFNNLLTQADITINVSKKTEEKKLKIIFSSNQANNFSKNIIHVGTISPEVEGRETKETTGKKETGEKAKGAITIYNKTDKQKTFKTGTITFSQQGLSFQLTENAEVASTSPFSTSFSNIKVKVEAAKFGEEYNLPSNTNFEFKDFPTSTFFAKNEIAFSGGTKKEIRVVSSFDLDSLTEKIIESLKKKALSSASSKTAEDNVVLPDIFSSEFIVRSFDKKENEEEERVTISAKMRFTIGLYNRKDLLKLVEEGGGITVPHEYAFQAKESRIDVKNIKVEKENNASADVTVGAVFLPRVNTGELIKSIKGKSRAEAVRKIRKISGVLETDVKLRNRLFFFPERLPDNPRNISINIVSK